MSSPNNPGDLGSTFEPEPVSDEHRAALRARLAEQAEAEGLLDVAYRTVDSPLGTLLVAATDAVVVRIALEREDHDAVLASIATSVSPRVLRTTRRTDPIARQLGDYFDGRRRAFDVPSTSAWWTGSAER